MLRNGPLLLIFFATLLALLPRDANAVGPVDGRFVFGPKIGATFTLVDGYHYDFTEREWGVDAGAGIVAGYRFSRHPNDVGVGLESGVFFMRRHIRGIEYDAVYSENWSAVEIPILLTIHAPILSSARPRIAIGPYFNVPVAEASPALLALQAALGVEVQAGPGAVLIEFAYQRQFNAYRTYDGGSFYAQSLVGYVGLLF